MEELRLRLLLPSIALIVITTMVPAGLRHFSLHAIVTSFDPTDFSNNILLYMPLGIALGGTSLLRATTSGFLLSSLAEFLQISYVDRMPSPIDVTSNTLGAVVGYLVAKAIQRMDHDPTSLPIPRWLAAISMVVGILGAIGLIYHPPPSDFSNWEPAAHLSIDPWKGNLSQLQIYPYSMESSQIQGLSCAKAADFPAGGLLPAGDEHSFFEALTRQKRLTIAACLESNDFAPRISRIVTYARARERNFTLAQMGSGLVFLVRTPASGPNGWASAVHSGAVLEANREVLAVGTYDGRISRLFVDGQLAGQADLGERRPHLPGRVLSWLPQPVPVREIELGAAEAVLAGLLSLGILGTFGVPPGPWLRAMTGVAAGGIVGGIVWVFGVSAPHLGTRILLESIAAGLTIAVSVMARNEARRPDGSGSGKESSSLGIPAAARSPHPVSASPQH
jgi:hypothetical protein